MRPVEVTVGGNDGTLATTYRTFDLTPGVALAINLTDTELIAFNNNVFSNNQQPGSGMDEQFKFAESPYLRNMYYPSNRPTGYTPQYTCDGRVNRPSLTMQPFANADGVVNHISMKNHAYNQLTACPLNR